ncbi:hypothetical protein [Methylocella silvestris]|uniref:hypothetical protein n=1 Tax=Methylocella silvestris TaxID=199596 RepID=UPI0003034E09|nr:hypothetical protein [Methylocella silvestris]
MGHVEATPGVVVVLAGWMPDPVTCASMGIRAPRSMLTDLHRLLAERGFRESSLGNSRIAEEEQNEQVAASGSDIPAPSWRRVNSTFRSIPFNRKR